jgi:hypothetical protein
MCWEKVRVQQIIGVRIIKIGFYFFDEALEGIVN